MSGFFFRLDQGVIHAPGGPVKSRLAVRAIVVRAGLLDGAFGRAGGL